MRTESNIVSISELIIGIHIPLASHVYKVHDILWFPLHVLFVTELLNLYQDLLLFHTCLTLLQCLDKVNWFLSMTRSVFMCSLSTLDDVKYSPFVLSSSTLFLFEIYSIPKYDHWTIRALLFIFMAMFWKSWSYLHIYRPE